MSKSLVVVVLCTIASGTASARQADVSAQARTAQSVVLASVEHIESRFAMNEFGDSLIVSDLLLGVHETLKGTPRQKVMVTVEGGTVGALTLRVSDMPFLKAGDRAIFFLDLLLSGEIGLHNRGAGVLKVAASNRIEGTRLSVADVRRAVLSALQ